jgi:aspartyl protease family protein
MLYRFTVAALLLAGVAFFLADSLPGWLSAGSGKSAAPVEIALDQPVEKPAGEPSRPVLVTPRPLNGRVVEVLADRGGHFLVDAEVDGRRVEFFVDTGATYIALNADTARRLNIRPLSTEYTVPVSTANGGTFVAPVLLDEVRIDDIVVRNVWALVHRDNGLEVNLLGMNFLSELRSFEMRGDRLTLSQ